MPNPNQPDVTIATSVGRRRRRMSEISARQLECLRWAKEGKSSPDIGCILGISARTVEGHIARVCELLGVRTRIQAILKAKDLGLFEAV